MSRLVAGSIQNFGVFRKNIRKKLAKGCQGGDDPDGNNRILPGYCSTPGSGQEPAAGLEINQGASSIALSTAMLMIGW